MTNEGNAILFERWRTGLPRSIELRLDDKTSGLEMTVLDGEGNIVATLAYDLVCVTPGFDLALLRAAWDEWRGGTAAS
jgi:hypothetical protein